jgi:hypothetical protein
MLLILKLQTVPNTNRHLPIMKLQAWLLAGHYKADCGKIEKINTCVKKKSINISN